MCIAAPGKVVSLEGRKAEVLYGAEKRRAMIADVPAKIDDWVLVQMGIIIKVLSQDEATASQAAWSSLS